MTDPTREAFEAWISAPPFEQSVSRLNASSAWPGSYRDIATDLAWQAWQAALSARAQGEAKPVATVCLRGDRYAGGHFIEVQLQIEPGTELPIGTKLYTTPAARAVDVDEAMVKRACDAFDDHTRGVVEPAEYPAMYAALAAALTQPEAE